MICLYYSLETDDGFWKLAEFRGVIHDVQLDYYAKRAAAASSGDLSSTEHPG